MLDYSMYTWYLVLPTGLWGLVLLFWHSPRYRQVERQREVRLLKIGGLFWLLVSLVLIAAHFLLRAG